MEAELILNERSQKLLKLLVECYILHLLNQCMRADGVKIYIGEESGYGPLDDCNMIAAPYRSGGKILGVLG